MSRSMTQLSVLALPAANVPPTRVATTGHSGGAPSAARNITGTVVTSNSSMIRGFVKATYARRTVAADRRLPANRSVDPLRAAGTSAASDRTGAGRPRREVDTADTGPPKAEIGRRRTPTVVPLRAPSGCRAPGGVLPAIRRPGHE